jgi:hypothetical protein
MNSSKPIKKGQIEDYISDSTQDALDLKADIGSGGATNLSYTPSPTNGTVTSDTGADATIPLADVTNAGLISPTEKAKIASAIQLDDLAVVATTGNYTDLVGVPSTFTPSSHTHPISQVVNLQSTLDLKVDKNTAITGATNTKITYDSKGLVTSGTSLVAGDIPNIAESKVTNLTTDLSLKAPLASPALTGTPTAPTAGAGTNTTQIATTAFVQGIKPYKSYVALINQSGTSDPSESVLENNLGFNITWTRGGQGYYYGTATGGFPSGKVVCFISGGLAYGADLVKLSANTFNNVMLTVADRATGGGSDFLANASIEIRVYN